jgi:hypothetical protein
VYKEILLVIVLIAILDACASSKNSLQSGGGSQPQVSARNSSPSQNEESPMGNREVQDSQIMDISKIDISEEMNWINPNNPPEMKRKYHKGYLSVILPEDIYPVKTDICKSGTLFKFLNTDAFMYIFSPRGVDGSALLDINLDTLDLNQTKGYHDMAIELRDNVLRMTYRFDGSSDGYVRYVEIQKNFQPPGMLISALIVKDPQAYTTLQPKYQKVLST